MNKEQFGRWGEDLAVSHLQAVGYELVVRNWQCEVGEIDLVMRQDEAWVFVEVKARRSERFGSAAEAITSAKQKRLLETGHAYLAEHDLDDVPCRIDVVAITVVAHDYSDPIVEVYENAVSEW
jgi:putative endonuclease